MRRIAWTAGMTVLAWLLAASAALAATGDGGDGGPNWGTNLANWLIEQCRSLWKAAVVVTLIGVLVAFRRAPILMAWAGAATLTGIVLFGIDGFANQLKDLGELIRGSGG